MTYPFSIVTIDYEELERDARAALEPPVKRLQGIVQVWTMFTKAFEVGKELRDLHGNLSVWSKHALTAMMVIDYAKPWSGNREPSVRKLDLLFLSGIEGNPVHRDLIEYRNQAAAHLDAGAQPAGVGLIGTEAINGRPALDEFDKVLVPGRVRIDVAMTLGLNDVSEVAAIVDHIKAAQELTEREVSKAAADVRNTALNHAPVLDRIRDVVSTEQVAPDSEGKRQMPQHGVSRSPAKPFQRTVTLGGRQFLEVITVWESTPNMEFDVAGNGFRVQSSIGSSGDQADFKVTFLKCRTDAL